ncbi:uncharacterized protein LOC129231388 [Uloborus diversus]|uniref:uncharacterized protein LOC129231388 n=1 Tax=Uloborus diversus TaxID=327109 RepID=UPI002409D5D0|nr:uncharacterized protein LOC129231388 [Uloborus diversus]
MADKARKFQIVIKGGQPWGFRLHGDPENRFAVIVDQIEPGGKAETQGELKKGDQIIKINDVQCLSLSDALQLIESAFRTLTILVQRSSEDSNQRKINIFGQKSVFSLPYHCQNSAANSVPSSVFHEFQDYKDNISTQKLYRKVTHTSLTSNYENISSLNLLNSHTSSLKNKLQCSVPQSTQSNLLENHSSENNSLKKYRSINSKEIVVKQKNFLDLVPTSSNHDTNLNLVCEKVPLPQMFFSNSSELKLHLQPIHSKKSHTPSQLVQNHHEDMGKKYQTVESSSNKYATANKVARISFCMYPNCSSKNINCTIHSPPEKDNKQYGGKLGIESHCKISVPKISSTIEQISCHIYANDNAHLLPSIGLKENPCVMEPNNQVENVDYDKCNMTGDINIPNYCDNLNTMKCCLSQNNEHLQNKCKNVYASTVAEGEVTQCSNQINTNFVQAGRKDYNSESQFEYLNFINRETIPNVTIGQTMLVDQAKEIQVMGSESKSFGKDAMKLSLFNENANNVQFKNSIKKKCFLDETKSLFSATNNNTCLKFSENRTVMKLYTCADEKDIEEDEELCFIEEKVKNMIRPSCTPSASPDLPLPPPPVNSHSEIIPTNEPLPSPPCLSPIPDEPNHEKPEAVYANLEMLKIKCAVVNSSTQTASSKQQTAIKNNSFQELENISSFSCIRSDLFNNMLAPAFEKTLSNTVIKNLLRQQLQKPVAKKLDVMSHNTEKEVTIERHSLSLPLTSAYFTTSEPKAKLLTRYVSSFHEKNMAFSGELSNKKEELMESISKKLEVLKQEQVALQEEMKQNDELGKSIADKIDEVAKPHESKKFLIQVEELVKITNLMSSLSGRLARAENALLILPSNASVEEKAVLELKYLKLKQQYEEALFLKSNNDKRNNHLSLLLRKYFDEEDLMDYDHFIRMKAKLLVDLKELDEKIKLGEEQLSDLQSSVNTVLN